MNPQLAESVTTRANPLIDPSLHTWGWEIVVYLFLGGMAAGILILTASLELARGRKPSSRPLQWMPLVALGLISIGMLALWLDLAHRLWAWRFYATWRLTSPMSWGAWILVLVYPAGVLLSLGSLDEKRRTTLFRRAPRLLAGPIQRLLALAERNRRRILLASVGAGVALGIYTGLLLGTMPSRLLWNTAVMGPLFLASGISTGAAFLLLQKLDEGERRFFVRWDAIAIAAELVLIGLMLVGWSTAGTAGRFAASEFLGGPYTAPFWSLVVLTGLVVPLGLELLETRRHLRFVAIIPVLILCSGLALRWILLVAGQATGFRSLP